MNDFFNKYWQLFYFLFFILLGILIYSILWQPNSNSYKNQTTNLIKQLDECKSEIRKDSIVYIIDTIYVNRATIDCDATVKSGGQGKTETIHYLGSKSGYVIIDFDMDIIPDEMIVFFNNKKVASTNGSVQGIGNLKFDFDASKDNSCKVIVKAPQNNTEWKYIVNCPR